MSVFAKEQVTSNNRDVMCDESQECRLHEHAVAEADTTHSNIFTNTSSMTATTTLVYSAFVCVEDTFVCSIFMF